MDNKISYTPNKIDKPTVVMIDQRIAISGALINMFKVQARDWDFLSFQNVPEAIDQTYNINVSQKLFLLNVGGIELFEGSLEGYVTSLRHAFPDVPIIIFADNEDLLDVNLFSYLKLNGFMTTSIAPEVLTAIMRLVIAGEVYIPKNLVLNLSYHASQDINVVGLERESTTSELKHFTPRQRDVLELLHYGLSNKVIADRLNICVSTVKVHMSGIMKKLEATNRTQAAYLVSKLFGQQGSGNENTASL